MKSLKAKRIAAVAGGAALLGLGLAFASPVTFQNVPIINNAGAPVVQVVLGHSAQPSDGVAAASIAAAIGNLAYASIPVTASVNAIQALSVLGATVPSSQVSLSNQQVWLNESASASLPSNVYGFTALIGSVLNHAVQLSAPSNTKSLQSSSTYAYASGSLATNISPVPSPYVSYGTPASSTVTDSYNGGGVAFTSGFRSNSTGNWDNILQVSSTQLPSLMNNIGNYGETEYLWVTGFPVYNQTGKTFNLAGASGAYQVLFNKPINQNTSSNSLNTPDITLLGQNWTILNYSKGLTGTVTGTSTTYAGGKIALAQSLTPVKTLYVGQNFTVDNFTIELADLGRADSTGSSPAILNIFYNGGSTPANITSSYAPNVIKFNVSGHILFVKVKNVTNGYTVQYAKVQAYSNVYNITSGQVFNQTNNPGWSAQLLWTNVSGSTAKFAQLQSIILINSTAVTLTPGQSFSFVQDPSAYKLTFVGDTLGSSNFDPISFKSQNVGSVIYANLGTANSGLGPANAITNVTEPGEELVVTSTISGAFTAGAQPQSSTLTFLLTPYNLDSTLNGSNTGNAIKKLDVLANVVNAAGAHLANGLIDSSHQVTVTVSGYNGLTHVDPSFTINTAITAGTPVNLGSFSGLSNVTSIKLSKAIPGLSIYLVTNSLDTGGITTGNSVASLVFNGTSAPYLLYSPATGKVYDQVSPTGSATYNQHNGQPTTPFALTPVSSGTFGSGNSHESWKFTANELSVASNSSVQDQLGFGLFNNTAGLGTEPLFILNGTLSGTKNNVTYNSSQGTPVNANESFVTERGSKVASIAPYSLTFDIAKAVDTLQFTVGPSSANTSSTTSYSLYGPYGVGQATNIANVSIGKVTGNASVAPGASFTITGVNNITAIPSVSSTDRPVLLKNLSAGSPNNLVVVDSAANAGSTLILVGSGYVNTLSGQLEQALNIDLSSSASSPVLQAYAANTTRGARILVAGYTANDTTQEANTFIQDLYNAAASS